MASCALTACGEENKNTNQINRPGYLLASGYSVCTDNGAYIISAVNYKAYRNAATGIVYVCNPVEKGGSK